MADADLVKVVLTTPPSLTDDQEWVETPWARVVGDGLYELDNLPWYAYGISLGDRFEGEMVPGDPRPHVGRIVAKSGNRTLRIILKGKAALGNSAQAILDAIPAMGCSYEGMNHTYVAVNVPPEVDLERVGGWFTEQGVKWEYADPTPEDLHQS